MHVAYPTGTTLSAAQNTRRMYGPGDLDGIFEFASRIDVDKNQSGDDKKSIKLVITPDKICLINGCSIDVCSQPL